MNDSKNPLTSLGIMGPAVGLIVLLLNRFVFKGSIITDADVSQLIELGSGLFAAVTGIYGRWRATKTIG